MKKEDKSLRQRINDKASDTARVCEDAGASAFDLGAWINFAVYLVAKGIMWITKDRSISKT